MIASRLCLSVCCVLLICAAAKVETNEQERDTAFHALLDARNCVNYCVRQRRLRSRAPAAKTRTRYSASHTAMLVQLAALPRSDQQALQRSPPASQAEPAPLAAPSVPATTAAPGVSTALVPVHVAEPAPLRKPPPRLLATLQSTHHRLISRDAANCVRVPRACSSIRA